MSLFEDEADEDAPLIARQFDDGPGENVKPTTVPGIRVLKLVALGTVAFFTLGWSSASTSEDQIVNHESTINDAEPLVEERWTAFMGWGANEPQKPDVAFRAGRRITATEGENEEWKCKNLARHCSARQQKTFAYMIMGLEVRNDTRLYQSRDRDLYWLTFKNESESFSKFVIHRPGTTWGEGRNQLLAFVFAAPIDYEFYIFLDEDILDQIAGDEAWTTLEQWLLTEKPRVGYVMSGIRWQVEKRLEYHHADKKHGKGLFAFDANLNTFHKSTIGYLVPYDLSLQRKSEFYSQMVMNWLGAIRYPRSTVGNTEIRFNYKFSRHHRKNRHLGEKDERHWQDADLYVLDTYFGGVSPAQFPPNWFYTTDEAPYVDFDKRFWFLEGTADSSFLTDSAVCLFGKPSVNVTAAFVKRVRSIWNSDVFQAHRFIASREQDNIYNWFVERGVLQSLPSAESERQLVDFDSLKHMVDRGECLAQIKKAEAARGAPYDRVAMGRADLMWLDYHPKVSVNGNQCWIATCGGEGEHRVGEDWSVCGREGFTSLVEGPMEELCAKGLNKAAKEYFVESLERGPVEVNRSSDAPCSFVSTFAKDS